MEVAVNKRLFITVTLLLSVMLSLAAEVVIQPLEGGLVEIIFTYDEPDTDAMGVIGSFDGWVVPGEPMERNEDGLWEYRLTANATDEITYKFYHEGDWITDPDAPEFKDDGYGGENGLIIVADILSGVVGGEGENQVFESRLNFGMSMQIGSKTTFITQGLVDPTVKGLEADSSGILAKSYWKINGSILPDVDIFFEIKAFDGYQNIWAQDATGFVNPTLSNGLTDLFTGILFYPVNFLGGSNPELNSIKTGIETPWVAFETGTGYAKPLTHNSAIWQTLNARDANDGYLRLDLGSELSRQSDVNIDATFAPNKMSGNYGLFTWLGMDFGDFAFDVQYDMKSAASDDLGALFDRLYHQDFILGLNLDLGDLEFKTNALLNLFSEADFEFLTHFAGEANVDMKFLDGNLGVFTGYRYTGLMAEMLYGDNGNLGEKGSHTVYLNAWGYPIAPLKLGFDTHYSYVDDENPTSVQDQAGWKIYADYNLENLIGRALWINVYSTMGYSTQPGSQFVASRDEFLLKQIGLKVNIPDPAAGINNIDIMYGYDGTDDEDGKIFNTLIAALRLANNVTAEAGLGLRTPRAYLTSVEKEENNFISFFLGGSWVLPVQQLRTPLMYGAFVYNMDPYGGDSQNLDLNGFVPSSGASGSDGYAQFRLMFKWDF
jgi:hypothetical protein